MKKLFAAVLCLLLMSTLVLTVSAAGSAHMSLSASAGTVYPGDTLTITVKLSNDQPVSNGGIILKFDKNVFEITDGQCKVSGATVAKVDPAIGGGAFALETDKVVSGTIFTINLKVKSSAAMGSYTISGSGSLQSASGSISCSVSGTTVKIGCKHSFGSYTKLDAHTHQSTCTICGEKKTENHVWEVGKKTEPTCGSAGSQSSKCRDCGAEKTEKLDATGKHKYGGWSKKDNANHVRSCIVCGKQNTAAHSWNSGRVTKNATCQQTGTRVRTCTDCKAEKTETIAKTAHSYGECTKVDETSHSHACTVCGKQATDPHKWDSGTVTKEATCLETGEKLLTCTGKGCGATKTEEIPLAAHTFDPWKKTDEASHTHACTLCGEAESAPHSCDDVMAHDENGHFQICTDCAGSVGWEAHVPGPEPTETTDQLCTVCSRVLRPNTLHAHEYSAEWTADEVGHWHGCKFCDEKQGFAAHAYENGCDSLCDVCQTQRTAPHTPEMAWSADDTGHWMSCADCGEKVGFAAHTPGTAATAAAPQLCTVCGYEIAPVLPHDHVYDGSGSTHTHRCACGEAYEADAKTCEICLAENRSFPWWIMCIMEAVAFSGVIAFLLWKKKNPVSAPEEPMEVAEESTDAPEEPAEASEESAKAPEETTEVPEE